MEVIKRSGEKESFDSEKIKKGIKKAYIDAGESLENNAKKIDKMAGQVSDWVKKEGSGIKTGKIKEKILDVLDKEEDGVSDAWRKFDKKYKKTK